MPDEILNLIGDIEIGVAGAGAIVFGISYATFFNWRKTEAGKALMYFVWALIALFVLNALGRWTGSSYPGREIIRPTVYTGLVITVWRLVWVLWRNWRRGADRPLDIESKPRNPAPPQGDIMLTTYSKSILLIIASAVTILVAALSDNVVTIAELVNVGIAIITAVGVYLVPNLDQGVARYFKFIVAILGAALTALASVLSNGVTTAEWLQILLAGLAAVGVVIVPNTPLIDARETNRITSLPAD
ncbi:hypothetical protein [Herbiconiux sp. UC225_62]|uniref:putative phage holin n=1 Tax=Herbiconiux sp. UC225_62 TaxID=3350168 RepID=UPI0036D29886